MQYVSSSENHPSLTRDSTNNYEKGKRGYAHRKTEYSYSSSGNDDTLYLEQALNKNVDQLDALLQDLKYERTVKKEKSDTSPVNLYERNTKVISIDKSDVDKDLKNISITQEILPVPGTRVTTTVRTYTYEVPAGATMNTFTDHNQQNIYTNPIRRSEAINSIPPLLQAASTTPHTVVYNTESNSIINRKNELPVKSKHLYEIRDHRETNNYQNNIPCNSELTSGNTITRIYNSHTNDNDHTTLSLNSFPHNSTRNVYEISSHQSPHSYEKPGLPTNKYFYKESSNVVNTVYESKKEPNLPNSQTSHNLVQHDLPYTTNVVYKYSNQNVGHGSPSSISQPSPFPVEGQSCLGENGNTPQRVNDLMQSFSRTDTVDKSDMTLSHRKREIPTAVASLNQQVIPTINKAGKEVYYPPGHDIMIKHEEMAAGSAGGGRWGKGSGMYEYESGYKSKTKTKSGGAIVPVCLPLCCAMPCSIM